jgi:hypothetical protein
LTVILSLDQEGRLGRICNIDYGIGAMWGARDGDMILENFRRRTYAETFDQRLLCAYNDQTVDFKDELKAEPSHIVFKSIVLLKNCILLFRVKFDDLLH